MARVVIAPAASEALDQLIHSLDLASNTREWVRAKLKLLSRFPRRGPELQGRWKGFRFVLGPWPRMLIVYAFDKEAYRVSVVTIRDARSARSATSRQGRSVLESIPAFAPAETERNRALVARRRWTTPHYLLFRSSHPPAHRPRHRAARRCSTAAPGSLPPCAMSSERPTVRGAAP